MSRSLLTAEELVEAQRRFRPPVRPPDGELERVADFPAREFSEWILDRVLARLAENEKFNLAAPVLLGSGARGELAPRSDFDVLFAGSDADAASLVRSCQERGFRLRSRTPEDPNDWTVGVEAYDELALLEGKALTPTAQEPFLVQRRRLLQASGGKRRAWLAAILKDFRERETRYNSIANVLEPNLKYGPGGLRDLDQARQVAALFPEKMEGAEYALKVMNYYAAFWTTLRQKLHLEGQGDILMSATQFDLAAWFGMQHKDFMREVQRGLFRVRFYAEWILARAKAPSARSQRIENKRWRNPSAVVKDLEKDPSVLMQHHVRRELSRLFSREWIRKHPRQRGALLWRVLRPEASEEFLVAVFSSRLIDRLCPEIQPLVGYVQHDQYHRYTADIHLQQACREFKRAARRPQVLGVLSAEWRALSAADRKILAWSVLYHDLMKGREGDHSQAGAQFAETELKSFGVSAELRKEVAWMVENHLVVSQAAFRRNPLSPATWTSLKEAGVEGARLRRLAIFTALDIRATNPEAWTPWKARLLLDLLQAARSPSAVSFFKVREGLLKKKAPDVSAELDSFLTTHLSPQRLVEDLIATSRSTKDLPADVFQGTDRSLWVRFHVRKDVPGLFLGFVQRLYSLGLGVRHASVHTLPGVGVYDWFQVDSRKTAGQIRKLLSAPVAAVRAVPTVKFEKISLVSADENEWVLSFKGLDQPGCLVAAAQAISRAGLRIHSARVHTWGRQVDDLFYVTPAGDPEELIRQLSEEN